MTTLGGGPLGRLGARQVVWIVALAALLAFLPSIATGFVFDDDELIVRNPYAHDLRYVGRCFSTDLWDTPGRPVGDATPKFYRPVVCALNILDFEIGKGAAWPFHFTNVLLHAGASALAARLALRWTGSPVGALIAALLFAVHPSRSESVVWVSGRTDVLMTLFLLAALELAVSGSERKRGGLHFALSLGAWLLALLSKELAMALPLFLAVEVALARQAANNPQKARRLTKATLAALVGSLLYLAVRTRTLPIRPGEATEMAMSSLSRGGYVLLSLGYYVERLVWPWPQTFYFRPVSFANGAPALYLPSVVLGGLSAIAFCGWFVVAWRRDRVLALALTAAAGLLLPALNVTETGVPTTTADRFLYLPLLPLAVAAARHARAAIEAWAARSRLAPLVVSAVVLVGASVSWVRSLDFASDEAMWRHELELSPDNPMALGRLGQALASDGDLEDAEALLRRALAPEALQFQLIANPSLYYLGLLEIEGPLLADGNVPALRSLLREILIVQGGETPDPRRRSPELDLPPPPPDPHFRIHAENAKTHLLLAGALLASRLPNDEQTRAMASRLEPEAALDAGARFNLALALGRASDYAAARTELARSVAASPKAEVSRAAEALGRMLTTVADLRTQAATLPEPASSLARARAFVELGAYLRAARVLRTAHAAHPDDVNVRVAYFDALVQARLERDAEAVAKEMPGVDPSVRMDEARRHLSERTAKAKAPPPDTAWWSPENG
jgi:tetratricopeptide (TPR) repeat protein